MEIVDPDVLQCRALKENPLFWSNCLDFKGARRASELEVLTRVRVLMISYQDPPSNISTHLAADSSSGG